MRAQHLFVQEQQGAARLILSRRSSAARTRKMTQQNLHLDRTAFPRIPKPAQMDKASGPVDIRVLGPQAIVLAAYDVPHLIQEPRLRNVGKTRLQDAVSDRVQHDRGLKRMSRNRDVAVSIYSQTTPCKASFRQATFC